MFPVPEMTSGIANDSIKFICSTAVGHRAQVKYRVVAAKVRGLSTISVLKMVDCELPPFSTLSVFLQDELTPSTVSPSIANVLTFCLFAPCSPPAFTGTHSSSLPS